RLRIALPFWNGGARGSGGRSRNRFDGLRTGYGTALRTVFAAVGAAGVQRENGGRPLSWGDQPAVPPRQRTQQRLDGSASGCHANDGGARCIRPVAPQFYGAGVGA